MMLIYIERRIGVLQRSLRSRPSFTLVELLIATAIIGILAGMILVALAGAQRDALTARTRGTIKKINDIILFRWEEFRYRSAKINIPDDFLRRIPESHPSVALRGQIPVSPKEGARLRMQVIRDLMRMELPDRYMDVLYPPTIYKAAAFTADNVAPYNDTTNDTVVVTASNTLPPRTVPGIYNGYREAIGLAPLPALYTGGVAAVGTPPTATTEFQGAEWLYQVVVGSSYNGSNSLEFFRPSEIGDTDSDGLPEFLDAWGRPIRWLRWPAGYGVVNDPVSPARPAWIQDRTPVDSVLNDKLTPDPLDPLRTDWRWTDPGFNPAGGPPVQKPWMLVPLVVSAGPDGMFDIQFDEASAVAYAADVWARPTGSPAHFSMGSYYFIDPYRNYYDMTQNPVVAGVGGLGQFIDEDGVDSTIGNTDNITNYEIMLE